MAIGGLGFLLMAGMDHHSHAVSCPFMIGEQAVCGMDEISHATIWKAMFAATIPSLLLAIALFAAAIAYRNLFEPAVSPPQAELDFMRRSPTIAYRNQYQVAFSQGIIHPKAP